MAAIDNEIVGPARTAAKVEILTRGVDQVKLVLTRLRVGREKT